MQNNPNWMNRINLGTNLEPWADLWQLDIKLIGYRQDKYVAIEIGGKLYLASLATGNEYFLHCLYQQLRFLYSGPNRRIGFSLDSLLIEIGNAAWEVIIEKGDLVVIELLGSGYLSDIDYRNEALRLALADPDYWEKFASWLNSVIISDSSQQEGS